ncbi:MAG: DUF624 domain-containing protein [Sporolactobacillus sp.]|jgi:uncharacterized membrane protein YesL|nr:DUF624 domain-containing protein [Sporolactobacillus sp.]
MLKHTNIVTKWIYAVVRNTIVWWMAEVPYLLLMFVGIGAKSAGEIGTLVLAAVGLFPFVLMPGLLASLGVAREFYRNGNEFPLFSTFFHFYRREYKNAMKIGTIEAVLIAAFYTSYVYYSRIFGALIGMPFLLLLLLSLFFSLFLLALLADRQLPLIGYFQTAGLLMIRHPVLIVSMVFEIFLLFYLAIAYLPALLLFVCPGTTFLLVTHFYRECVKQEEEKGTLID